MGNPFQEESADLLVLDTKNVADPALAAMIGTLPQRRKDQLLSFMEGLEKTAECTFYQPIKKNPVTYFKQVLKQHRGNSKEKVLKDDCQLFSRLFISCQNRQ